MSVIVCEREGGKGRGRERAESKEGVRFLGDGIVALRSYPMLEPNFRSGMCS